MEIGIEIILVVNVLMWLLTLTLLAILVSAVPSSIPGPAFFYCQRSGSPKILFQSKLMDRKGSCEATLFQCCNFHLIICGRRLPLSGCVSNLLDEITKMSLDYFPEKREPSASSEHRTCRYSAQKREKIKRKKGKGMRNFALSR